MQNLLYRKIKAIIPFVFVIILMQFLFFPIQGIGQPIYSGPASGQISGGVQVSTTQFLNMPESTIPGPQIVRDRPPFQYIDDSYNNTPAAAPMGSNLFTDPAVIMGVTQQIHAPFTAVDFQGGWDPGNTIPPDPDMAVGPNHVITVQNAPFMRIFDKKGNLLQIININAWFSTTLPGADPFDCHIIYDHFAGRWVQLWDHWDDGSQIAYWLVSVSDDSDPFGTWTNFGFPANLNGSNNAFNWGDYPKIGYDHQAIYISGRMFSYGGGLQYCKLRIISKTQLYDPSAGPVDYTHLWNFRDPSNPGVIVDGPPVAANHLDSTNTAYLVVDSPYVTSTFITIWKITNPLSTTPIVTALNIPTASALRPPDGNQLGGGTPRLNSGRRAYRRAQLKNGHIWSATAIAGGTSNQYAYARYVRVDAINNTLVEDVAIGANGFYYLYPFAMVDEDNNLTMVFTRSADTEYAAAAYTGRRDTDPAGLSPSVVLKPGESNYIKTFSGTRNRWGDYLGIALDPVNSNTVWGFMEYAASPANTFGVWTAAFVHQYALSGIIRNTANNNPLELVALEVQETGKQIQTDSTGIYSFGSQFPSINVDLSAFAYQDTTYMVNLTLYSPDTMDLFMEPEIEAVFSGQVSDPSSGQGIPSTIEFYAEGNPRPGPYQTITTDANGNYNLQTIIGTYNLILHPQSPYPYTEIDSLVLTSGGLTYDIQLSPADVMLVDDDAGQNYEGYFTEALKSLSRNYHRWDVSQNGSPSAAEIAEFPMKLVIWFTGDGADSTLTQFDQNQILSHLNNGGRLFLTGQNIAEQIDGTPLLNTLGLGFASDNSFLVVVGVAGDIGDGLAFSTIGSQGANNQTSKDQLAVQDSTIARSIFTYGANQTATAGAAVEIDSSKMVFFGFGFEAISNKSFRESTLQAILNYLDQPTAIDANDLAAQIPQEFRLMQNFPNPFNPETTIRFAVPTSSDIKIVIYNSLGQKVRLLTEESFSPGYHEVVWNGLDDTGTNMPSGVYFYRMSTEEGISQVKKLLLMK
jgi:hypothetical protein